MRYLLVGFLCLWMTNAWALVPVLSKTDVKAYQRVLTLHKSGEFKTARAEEKKIKNKLLQGYILFDRYFSSKYKTSQKEIAEWMDLYSDLPIAVDVYALGIQKKVKDLKRPKGLFGSNTKACSAPSRQEPIDLIRNVSFSYLEDSSRKKASQNMRKIVSALNKGDTITARQLIQDKKITKLFNREDLDKAKTALAFSYLLDGQDALALDMAQETLGWPASSTPLAYWIAGLACWRQGDFEKAAKYFSDLATQEDVVLPVRARSSFWAARSYLSLGQNQKVIKYLQMAAEMPRNFYGMLATRALGQDLNYVWDTPVIATDEMRASFSHPALERFYALRQIKQDDWAMQELSKLYLEADDEGKAVLTMISQENKFDDALQGVTGTLQGEEIRYPMPNWKPQEGWKLEKELVFAFVRQESCFNHRAESHVGALGLMQLMPDTAKELARGLQCRFSKRSLKNPAYNLYLGQAYLLKLMEYPQVQDNLMFMAAAYNAGPGNLNRWKKKMVYNEDPLLFIEVLPSKETRGFVEHILMNYWVYRNLTGASLTTLDAVVQGRWPIYDREETTGY